MKKTNLNSRDSGNTETLEEGNSLLLSLQKTKSEAGLVQIRLLEIVRPDPEQSGDLKLLFQSLTQVEDSSHYGLNLKVHPILIPTGAEQ